jgi:hypothetical protein
LRSNATVGRRRAAPPCAGDLLERAQRAVLHAHAALVAQEHDPVAGREVARPARPVRPRPRPARRRAQPIARLLVQLAHLGVGVGEDDPGLVRLGLALAIPAVHQLARAASRVSAAWTMPCRHRRGSPRRCGRSPAPASRPLPVLALPANLGDLGRAVPLGDRPERRAGLDRLQLLGIAHQHHLGAGRTAWDSTRSIWRVPIMPASSTTSTSRGPAGRGPAPCVFKAGDGAGLDARSALQILGRDPGQRRAAHLIACALPSSRATPSMADLPVPA